MSNFTKSVLSNLNKIEEQKNENLKDILLLTENSNNENKEFLTKIGFDTSLKIAEKIKNNKNEKSFYYEHGFNLLNFDEMISFIETLRIHADIEISRVDSFKGTIKESDIETLKKLDEIENNSVNWSNLFVIFPKKGNIITQDKYILIYVPNKNPNFFNNSNKYVISIITENSIPYTRFKIEKELYVCLIISLLMSLFISSLILYLILNIISIGALCGKWFNPAPPDWKKSSEIVKYYQNLKIY